MASEIGSEFWKADLSNDNQIIIDKPHQFLLTGRTALDFIIKDIKAIKTIKVVYMPSYCCHTMIQPFLNNGIAVKFYNINFENGKYSYDIDYNTICDAVLIMQYFGYSNESVGQAISKFKECGKTIIEDATHSWFSENPYNNFSDYVFASFRKWSGLPCGAIVLKQSNCFSVYTDGRSNLKYVEMRKQAALLKKHYIEDGIGQKETFLKLYNQAEKLLEGDYQNYDLPKEFKDDILKLDAVRIRKERKSNARYLIEGLKKCNSIDCIIQADNDTPLFVPIIILNGKRDELRQYLINNEIYCPVHWPLSIEHKVENKYLYHNSLSLICDQRYTLIDMERIIKCIYEFYGG